MCVDISDANFNISKHTLRFFFQRLQTHSSTFFSFFLRNFSYPVVRSEPKELWVSLGIHVSYEMRSRTENFPTTLPCGPPPHLPPRPSAFVASGLWGTAGKARLGRWPEVWRFPWLCQFFFGAQPWYFREEPKIQRADVNR